MINGMKLVMRLYRSDPSEPTRRDVPCMADTMEEAKVAMGEFLKTEHERVEPSVCKPTMADMVDLRSGRTVARFRMAPEGPREVVVI